MPKLSVLIPAYIDHSDKLPWLRDCLQSIQDQTLTDWEALIIDDASPMLIGEVKAQFSDELRQTMQVWPSISPISSIPRNHW